MLLQQIKADQVRARKLKDKASTSILTTLYSEAANVGLNDGKRESTDAEVIAVVKKFVKGIDDTLKIRASEELSFERKIILTYLPKQMTLGELGIAVRQIMADAGLSSMKDMGKVMAALKAEYGGEYDGKMASNVVKAELSA